MNPFDSFQQFEEKFGTGNRYAEVSEDLVERLKTHSFPDFYMRYIQENGFKEFFDGFWWFTDPFNLAEDLSPFTGHVTAYPIIRNALGCFLVFLNGSYYHLNVHTRSFGVLGDQLGLIFNFTFTDDYALRDMFFFQLFDPALKRLGKVEHDEIYAFVPALALGGEIRSENIHIVKLREHLHLLAQL
jgi:hypothetical protein